MSNIRKLLQYQALAEVNIFPNVVPVISSQAVVIYFPMVTQYQALAFSELEIEEREPVNSFSWHPDYIFDRPRLQHTYPTFWIDDLSLTQPEVPQLDKWFFEHLRQAVRLQATPHLYPYFSIDATVLLPTPEQITRALFQRRPDFAPGPKDFRWLYPPFTVDAYQLTLIETTTMDKWFFEHLRQAVRLRRTPEYYPYFSFHPVPFENAFSLASKRNTTNFTELTKNQSNFTPMEKNQSDFTSVSKNVSDWTDP